MATYSYSIAVDTATGKARGGQLAQEVSAAIADLLRIDTAGDVLDVVFSRTLTAGEESTLDGIVAAHAGVETTLWFRGGSLVVGSTAVSLTAIGSWQEIGAFDFDLSLAMKSVARATIRIVATGAADGTGARLRLVEDDLAGNVVVLSDAIAMADTRGAAALFKFDTTVAPNAGLKSYRLEGQLGADAPTAAASASVKHCHAAFVETFVF